MVDINNKTSVIFLKIGRTVLISLMALTFIYWVFLRLNCGFNESDDFGSCTVLLTVNALIPFIILVPAFFLVGKHPIIGGIMLVSFGVVILVIPYTSGFLFLTIFMFYVFEDPLIFSVPFIINGLLFITCGLLEMRDRSLYKIDEGMLESSGVKSNPLKPIAVRPTKSSLKTSILITASVLLLITSTAIVDLVRYNQMIYRENESSKTYFDRGLAAADRGDYASAVPDFTQAIELNSRYTEAYYNRGLAYLNLMSIEPHMTDAINDFDHVIQLDPNYAMAYFYSAILRIYNSNSILSNSSFFSSIRDNADLAINDISQYLQLKPDDAVAYNYRGLAYFIRDDLNNAIQDFSQAIQLDPNFAIAYNNRGLAYSRNGNPEQAIFDYDKAVHLKPDFSTAYFNRGQAYDDKGDLDLAITDWEQAARIKPASDLFFNLGYVYYEQTEILDRLGMAYIKKGDLDLAIDVFDQIIQLRPGYGLAYYNRGLAYYYKGMYPQALNDFYFYKPDYTNVTMSLYYRGLANYYSGNQAAATQDFYGALTYNPDYSKLLEDWQKYLGDKDYLDRAISDFSRAIQLNPNDPQLYLFRGLVYSIKGETGNAIADLSEVLKLCDPNTTVCKDAQQGLQKLGNPK